MTVFLYTALDKAGAFAKGSVSSSNVKKATKQLEKDGFLVVNIKKERSQRSSGWNTVFNRVSRQDKIFFTRHLFTLLESGVPIDQTLQIAAEQATNDKFAEILKDVHKRILAGQSLHSAFEQHKKYFSNFFVNLIKVGERSGKLHEVLLHILEQQEQDQELVSKVRGALIYPSIIIVAAFSIVTFMMVFVVPKITGILAEYNVELPLLTRILIATSHFISTWGIIAIPGGLVLIIGGLRLWVSRPGGKSQWDAFKLRVPVLRNIVREFNLARIARAMSALLKSGVPVDQALELAASVSGNTHYQKSLRAGIVFVRKGIAMTEIFKGYPNLYPPLTTRMVDIGERSGRIDHMFDKLAAFYEKSVTNTLSNLSTIIEPLLLLFIGFVVAFLGVAILTPIWKFSETV